MAEYGMVGITGGYLLCLRASLTDALLSVEETIENVPPFGELAEVCQECEEIRYMLEQAISDLQQIKIE